MLKPTRSSYLELELNGGAGREGLVGGDEDTRSDNVVTETAEP